MSLLRSWVTGSVTVAVNERAWTGSPSAENRVGGWQSHLPATPVSSLQQLRAVCVGLDSSGRFLMIMLQGVRSDGQGGAKQGQVKDKV